MKSLSTLAHIAASQPQEKPGAFGAIKGSVANLVKRGGGTAPPQRMFNWGWRFEYTVLHW